MPDRGVLLRLGALALILALSAACRPTAASGADQAIDAFMERIAAGDEIGARAYWAWDYPLGDSEDSALYSRLVQDLSQSGQRTGFERHSLFYYRDAAFSQPVKRPGDAQVSQVDVTLFVLGPGEGRVEERIMLVLARVPGTPQEWRIIAVRTDRKVIERFVSEVAATLEAES